MKADNHLTSRDWQRVFTSCEQLPREILLDAINTTRQYRNQPTITEEAAEHLSYNDLVKIVIKCLQETNTCDNSHIWIDPSGKYKVTIRVSDR